MSQFGGTKNPPWARPQAVTDYTSVTATSSMNSLPQSQVATPLMQQQQVQPMYGMANAGQSVVNPQQYTAQQLLGLQAQQQAAAALQQQAQVIPQPGIAIPTTLATTQVATVSYPAPRAAAVQANQPKQRVFTGTITKLHDNFGFVDEDVFFQTSCVKGSAPKVNDRVLVEASFNANMPFKWNATRIQVLPNQMSSQGNQHGLNKPVFGVQQGNQIGGFTGQPAPQPLMQQGFNDSLIPRTAGNIRRNERFDRERERKRDRERRERNDRPPAPRKRSRSKSPTKRAESNSHQRSPARRRPRIVPRYVVQVPKLSFDMKEANVISLKSRYGNLYIPSDFFNASFEWTEAFPCYRPFQMGNHCGFHVMHKDVEALGANESVLDPPDADHLFSAKVMLLSCPSLDDLYHKSCAMAEDPPDVQEGFVHPTRLIHFLVGLKGKNETMAIGGPWSPSLDGPKPREDPQVLIRTAIRTTKALTGIDLSSCTQWYQFAEVRYLRQEEMHKGKLVPAHVETTVIFLPDVWSCNPTRLEWATLQAAYKKQLQKKVAAVSKEGGKEANSQEEEDADGEVSVDNKEPTHHSELDPKTMKIIDLRRELECRSVSSKGLKSQLIARLTKTLKSELEKEEEQEAMEGQNTEVSEEVKKNLEAADEKSDEKKKEEEEKKKKEEREKVTLERRYALPDNPLIIVHPNAVAKGGKFDCSLMSLSVLLDYRPEDNKEHSFEVSLFAELFNEMLMRDYGFEIYKSLIRAPEKKEEEKKEKRLADDKSNKDASSSKKKKTDEKEKQDSSKKETKEGKEKEKKKEDDKKDQEKKDEDEDDDDEGKKDKDKDKKREKKKYQTRDPALLLAFTYFDQNHTGYLLDKDVEEIIHTIGLQLSRAQVKKLVQKVVTRDALNYRKITDKPVPTPGEKEESATEEKELKIADIVRLSKGNSEYLPGHSSMKSESVDQKIEKKSPVSQDAKEVQGHMITYKGAMVDLESLMGRLERSEKTRAEMEKQMMDVNKEKDLMKKSIDAKDEKSEKMSTELKNLKQKLLVQEKITNNSESTGKKYLSALVESREHLNAMLSAITNALGEKVTGEDTKKESESNGNS
ncbi:cell division cycle and apoptosis regulator protein 1-like isoform X3 [Ostrea edulis]|uniref:cell division cycle and apoptosis regulator protein 1-like isoform X3 n=1 Tax=Ostrea edulis TaxID=37623 RepID=UPI0024AE8F2F|nr:cell division cycle and apoptosis regulator protein 1-like isoform X3 [Ostrea edulis]